MELVLGFVAVLAVVLLIVAWNDRKQHRHGKPVTEQERMRTQPSRDGALGIPPQGVAPEPPTGGVAP